MPPKIKRYSRVAFERLCARVKSLPTPQLDALGAVAIGQAFRAPKRSLVALERKGLIFQHTTTLRFNDGLPAMDITEYDMEIGVHMAWAYVVSEELMHAAEDTTP